MNEKIKLVLSAGVITTIITLVIFLKVSDNVRAINTFAVATIIAAALTCVIISTIIPAVIAKFTILIAAVAVITGAAAAAVANLAMVVITFIVTPASTAAFTYYGIVITVISMAVAVIAVISVAKFSADTSEAVIFAAAVASDTTGTDAEIPEKFIFRILLVEFLIIAYSMLTTLL